MGVALVFIVAANVVRLFELGTKLCKLIHETSYAIDGPRETSCQLIITYSLC